MRKRVIFLAVASTLLLFTAFIGQAQGAGPNAANKVHVAGDSAVPISGPTGPVTLLFTTLAQQR